ncbi:MAG TPA: hypothetical protein VGI24_06835 [Solirubrobacteraceae bacterium]|jgi:hypothetical protein
MSVVASTPTFTTPASAKVPPTASTPTVATTAPTTTPTTVVHSFNTTAVNARAHALTHSHGSGHVSTEAIVLAAIAALLLLACAAWAFARSRAYEPHWLVSLRHAMAEAGFRTSATWAEFTDWARLGR